MIPPSRSEDPTGPAKEQWFATTHWSVVLAAGQTHSPQTAEALEKLCRTYWYPLYAYVRRRGYDADDAQDLTQEFFARLLEKNYLASVDRAKGKFRSFLLASLNHFLSNEWDKAKAAKRGGSQTFISLDEPAPESRYLLEPASDQSPEKIFEQRWAVTLLDQALRRLKAEFAAARKGNQFEVLQVFLQREAKAGDYSEVGAQLKMSSSAVAMAVARLRQRYRELVLQEIAQTVADPADVDDEMRHLFEAVGG